MPGAFDKFLEQYDPDIQKLLGNVDDIRVTNKYSDALNEINGMDAERQRIDKFYNLAGKIKGIDPNMVPNYNTVEEMQFNYDDPRIYQSDNELNAKYADYVNNWKTANKKDAGYMSFDKFIEAVPGLKDQMVTEGYFTKQEKQVPLNEQDMQQKIYETAGFTPEDIALYEEGLKSPDIFNQDRYNEKLQNMAYKYYPQLMSKGSRGNSLQDMLGERLKGKILNVKQGKNNEWKFEIENGHVIKYNTGTGEYSVTNISKDKEATTKNWEIFEDDNGNPYWGERVEKDGQWQIEHRAELNKAEKRSYETDLQLTQNKLDKSNNPTKRSGRRSGPSRKFSMSKMDVNEVKKIKPSDIGTKYKTIEQLEELQKNGDYLTDETRQAIEDYLDGGDPNDPEYKADEKADYDADYNYMKGELEKFRAEIEENVYAYDDGQGGRKPNYSISYDDWIRELDEAGFFDEKSPGQEKAVAEFIKAKTGR